MGKAGALWSAIIAVAVISFVGLILSFSGSGEREFNASADDFSDEAIAEVKEAVVQSISQGNYVDFGGPLVLRPSVEPDEAEPGQLYYDTDVDAIKYFDGTSYKKLSLGIEEILEEIDVQNICYKDDDDCQGDDDDQGENDDDDDEDDDDDSGSNDPQFLSLSGNTLFITGGNSVDLSKYLDNKDTQDLSLAGNTLKLVSGGSVNLAPYLDNTDVLGSLSCAASEVASFNGSNWVCSTAGVDTDDQTLSIDGSNNLVIVDGNSVSLAPYLDNTDAQDLTLVGNTLGLTGDGTSVDLSGYIDNTDSQAISVASDILSISGNVSTVDLSVYLDDTTLNEAAVDAFVANNGYLTSEVDASVSNELQDLSLAANVLSLSSSVPTVSLVPYLDNTDSQTLAIDGSNNLSVTGGNSVSLAAYLDNTDVLASLSCSNNEIAKWNGAAWACAADNSGAAASNSFETVSTPAGTNPVADSSTDTITFVAGSGLTIVGTAASDTVTFASTLGTSVEGAEISDNTIEEADLEVTNAGVDNYVLSYDAASGGFTWVVDDNGSDSQTLAIDGSNNLSITGGNSVSLAGYLDDTTLSEAAVEAFIFDGDNTGTLSAGTLALGSLSFTGSLSDTNVSDTLTIGAGSSVADGALSANVSLLGSSISGAEVINGTLEALDFETTNAATDNFLLSYDNASGGFTWVSSGAGESTTASNGLTRVGVDVQLGGTLTSATTIDLDNNNIDFDLESGGNLRVGTTTGGSSNTGKYLQVFDSGTIIGYDLGFGPSYQALMVVEEQTDLNGQGQRLVQRATSTASAINSSTLLAEMNFTGNANLSNNVVRGVVSEITGTSSGGSGGTGTYAVGVDANVSVSDIFEYAVGVRANVNLNGVSAADRGYGIYVDDITATSEEYGIYQYGLDDTNVFNGDTRIGGSTTAPPKLFVIDNPTDVTDIRRTVGISTTGSSNTADVTTVTGLYNHVNHPVNAGGSNTTLIGTDTTIAVRGAGTTDLAVAYDAFIDGDGTATNAYAYRADIDPWPAGSITNGYGLYVEDLDVTNGYGIYQNGSDDRNYFAGNLGIGVLPSVALDIAGAGNFAGMAAPAVSSAGEGRLYFDSTSNTFKVSENGGAYSDLVSSDSTTASNGLTETGDDIALGGTLSSETTIDFNNNNLKFDLESGGYLRVGTTTGGGLNSGKYLITSGNGTTIGYDLGFGPTYQALLVVEEQEDVNGQGQRLVQRATSTSSALTSSTLLASMDFTGNANLSNNTIRGIYSDVAGTSSGGSGGTGSIILGVDSVAKASDMFDEAFGIRTQVDRNGASGATTGYGLYVVDTDAVTNEYGIYQAGTDDKNYFAGDTNIGGAGAPADRLFVYDAPTDDTSQRSTIGSHTVSTSTNSGFNPVIGLDIFVNHTSQAGSSNTSLYGSNTLISPTGSGTIEFIAADSVRVGGDATTITDAYAYRADISPGGGTITNGYGLYIYDVVATNDYGVYQAGSNDVNYFAGNVGIGTTPTSYELQLGSDSAAKPGTSTWTISSDERLKDVLGDYDYGLDEILALDVVDFRYAANNALNMPSDDVFSGVLAQQVQDVIPEAVSEDEDGYLWVNTDPIRWAQLNAIKELAERLEVVEANPAVETLYVEDSAVFAGDITVKGHIVSAGDTPELVEAAGVSGEVDGTDTAGVVTLEADSAVTGVLASVEFDQEYGDVPVVTLSAANSVSAGLDVYYDATKSGFDIVSVDNLLPDTVYEFSYIVIE